MSLNYLEKQENFLAAIVLAGGKSSRMGQDKALLPIHGVPLLRKVWEAARNCTPNVYVVTSWPDRYRPILPDDTQFIQEQLLDGQLQGPLAGFAQGLAVVDSEWVLLLACDLPSLEGELLRQWAAGLDQVPEDAIALLPHHEKGWEPLCGFYRCRCLPQLTKFILQGGRSFQKWLAQCTVQPLVVSNPQMLLNCNRPEDWQQFQV